MIAALALCAFAQDKPDGDKLVTVPQRYVSAEGLAHSQDGESVSKWIGIGREIGIATKEGLGAVVDEANHFGNTRVGNFVLVMVAWRIIGHDLLRIVLGIPCWIAGVMLWIWSYRRFFIGYRVLSKREGKLKEWTLIPAYKFATGDARMGSGVLHAVMLACWCAAWIAIIF